MRILKIFPLLLALPGLLLAAPSSIRIQGRLTDGSGAPIVGDDVRIRVGLYPVLTGGTLAWETPSDLSVVTNDAGLFATDVGPIPSSVFSGNIDLYLELRVRDTGGLKTLSPRQKLAAVPYASHAQSAGAALSAEVAASVSDNSIGARHIQSESIMTHHMTTGSVTNLILSSASVDTIHLINNSVTDVKISSVSAIKISGQITAAQILSITAPQVTGVLTTPQIGDGQVTDVKIATVAASKIQGPLALDVIHAVSSLKFANFETLKILQIQQYSTQGQFSTSSPEFVDTNLKGTFTPKLATSKVLLFAAGNFTAIQNVGYATLARNGINLSGTRGGFAIGVTHNNYFLNLVHYDSPGTSSPVVYSVQIRTNVGTGTVYFPINDGGIYSGRANLIAVEIAQ